MRYLHYDVFTDRLFEGNQLAVFHDARGLSSEQMHALTREMNFSESTFVLPAEAPGTDIRMRIFTPGTELPMAGHPTIGTTFALAHLGVITPGKERWVFGLGIGPTPVELTWKGKTLDFAWMDQQPPQYREPASRADVIAATGIDPSAIDATGLPIGEVSCGLPYLIVPVKTRAALDAAEPDTGRLLRLKSSLHGGHIGVFMFTTEAAGAVTAYSRMFAPAFGVLEDPATGSASGPLGCYLVRHGLVQRDQMRDMVSLQGVKMGRPSRIHIRIAEDASGAITRVQVGGKAVRVGDGTIDL